MATRRPIKFKLSQADEANRTLTLVASTGDYIRGFEASEAGQIEVREAVTEWILDAFLKNPVVLAFHNSDDFPIARAEEVFFDENGLNLRLKFASKEANPKAEQAFQLVREGMLNAASVGFGIEKVLEEELIDGIPHRKVRAELHEVSLVPVPADPGATASNAKVNSTSLDSKDSIRLDYGRLGKAELTPGGGARIRTRFGKVGIQKYRMPDGSFRRELRHPDDVFHPDSMASLQSATVTDGHPYQYKGLVDPDNWKELTVGHVEGVERDGDYLSGFLVVNDAKTQEKINQGDREDNSCGYRCKWDLTPGVYMGEPYDVRQVDIKYNHLALLPPGRGRAGRDVALRLDENHDQLVDTKEHAMKKIRLDSKDYEVPEEVAAHIARLDEAKDEAEKALKVKEAESDKMRAEADAKEAEETKAKKRAEEEATSEEDEDEKQKSIRSRVRLLLRALRFLDDDKEEEDPSAKLDGLSDREIMLKAIQTQDAKFSGVRTDGKDESDDYVRARFDLLGEMRTDGMDALVTSLKGATPNGSKDPLAEARAKQAELNENAWKAQA